MVTPGSTPPEASRMVPATVACARTVAGSSNRQAHMMTVPWILRMDVIIGNLLCLRPRHADERRARDTPHGGPVRQCELEDAAADERVFPRQALGARPLA